MAVIEIEEEIQLDDAEDNPWYQFLLKSIELDKGDDDGAGARGTKPHGWHWFWGIYGLHREIPAFPQCNIDEIEKKLPNNECVKLKPHEQEEESFDGEILPSAMQKEATDALYNFLKKSDSLETVREIDFSKWNFPEHADLSYFIFPVDTSFEHASFAIAPNFSNTIFCDKANFNKATFTDKVFFNGAQFFDEASFTGTKFLSKIFSAPCFDKAVFSGRALFTYAEFEGIVLFKETIFSKDAIFQNTKFTWEANFKKAKFFENAVFTHATFLAEIKFDWANFEGHTDFINTKFKKYVPSFHKATMHSNTSWDWNVKFWPSTGKHKNDTTDKDHETRIKDNQNAYENLSSQMKGLDKYHDEHFFYRQEMCCRRWRSSRAVKFFYYLYEKLADYGYGIKHALWGWFWHMVLGAQAIAMMAFANAWLACWKGGAWEIAKSMACSVPISIANSHSFLFFNNGPFKECYKYFVGNNFFNTIWAFQTVLGIIFLFLLLLTLRIRFRLK